MKKYWNQLSRPTRVVIFLTVILLCAALTFQLLWTPSYNPEKVFRRMEGAELIGPSRILAIVETPSFTYTHLVVGDDGDHVVLCGLSKGVQNHDYLAYRPKQGEVTVYCAPIPWHYSWLVSDSLFDRQVPVVLLDNHPQADRAEIKFTVSHGKEYVLSGSRTAEGVFILPIHLAPGSAIDKLNELEALNDFISLTGASEWQSIQLSIPVEVKLFDQAGQVIHEETVTVRSPKNQFLAEQNNSTPNS